MELGETVGVAKSMQQVEEKCIICSEKHEEPKKENIQEVATSDTNWSRKSMKGKFQRLPEKIKIYPLNSFPPSSFYEYQGHHCIGLSSFVINANTPNRKDRRIRLNHFLKKVGFYPNRNQNCIGLPTRKGWGDFDAFWKSLDANKPLQLHGPGHDEKYFAQSNNLITRMVWLITKPEVCENITKGDWENDLKKLIEQAENYAFKKLSSNDFTWRLHHSELSTAIAIYFLPANLSINVKKNSKGDTERVNGKGNKERDIIYPNLNLDTGPFYA